MISAEALINSNKNLHLKGVLQIGGQRNFTCPLKNKDYFLFCHRFWQKEDLSVCVTEEGINLLEIFTIINDKYFLEKVQNNYLHIELKKYNGTLKTDIIGVLRLPLHQFFIAFRDATLTIRLCDEQFPVLSTDAWLPILNPITGEKAGEIECLFAIGTKNQIENIGHSKQWKLNGILMSTAFTANDFTALHYHSQHYISQQLFNKESQINLPTEIHTPQMMDLVVSLPPNSKTNKKSDLFNLFQNSIASTSPKISLIPPVEHMTERNVCLESFRVYLKIESAVGIPLNPPLKKKKKNKRSTTGKGRHIRFPPEEEPNTYVTFQANESQGSMVKSHEGMVYTTNVIEKTSNPIWNKSFHISVSSDYLTNKNKRFILKIWKKSITNISHFPPVPCPMEDSIIGFAAIDFTTFLVNVPIVTDLFNIVDFGGHINGQIRVTAHPLDDLNKLLDLMRHRRDSQVDNLLDSFESSLNINNINLSRAIKRKFTELEEISRRLRARLLDVTGKEITDEDAVEINDEQLDEFEHDLNTIACEDESVIDKFSSHVNCHAETSLSQNIQ